MSAEDYLPESKRYIDLKLESCKNNSFFKESIWLNEVQKEGGAEALCIVEADK